MGTVKHDQTTVGYTTDFRQACNKVAVWLSW